MAGCGKGSCSRRCSGGGSKEAEWEGGGAAADGSRSRDVGVGVLNFDGWGLGDSRAGLLRSTSHWWFVGWTSGLVAVVDLVFGLLTAQAPTLARWWARIDGVSSGDGGRGDESLE